MAALIDKVLGTDVLFNGTFPVTPKGDYQEVSGDENLRRAILRRMITNPGDYKKNPAYGVGLPAFIKKGMTASRLAELRHRILDNLSQERRIDKILSVVLTPTVANDQPALQVDLVVQSKGRQVRFQPMLFSSRM